MSYFSEKIKQLRESHNLTQKTVASKIGISQGNYSSLENAKYEPSLDTLIKLAEFYDVSIDELVTPVRFVTDYTIEAKSVAKQFDMLSWRDQYEIQQLLSTKMRWINQDGENDE